MKKMIASGIMLMLTGLSGCYAPPVAYAPPAPYYAPGYYAVPPAYYAPAPVYYGGPVLGFGFGGGYWGRR